MTTHSKIKTAFYKWEEERRTMRGMIIVGCVFLMQFYSVLPKLFLKTFALHPDILDFDLLSYLFFMISFHFGQRDSSSSSSESCQVNEGSRRAEGHSEFKEDRVNPYYSYLGIIVILSKNSKGKFSN